ncbi:DNA primase [Candidatus Darwinibacter acetoxidans]|jgi:DNA primase
MGIARFSEQWIERVKSSADIVEVIGRRVELRQSGKNYVGLCPFHSEKTPSFTVNPEKQFYHCFGCGKGGNVINFVMDTENLAFPEAVVKLAQEKGIPVPAASPGEQRREKEREQLRQVNQLAARYYYRNLRLPAGAQARAYLQGRGIGQELARSFFLGFALDEWDGLLAFLTAQGVDPAIAQAAGLVTSSKRGFIDRFRGRLMFPICDHLGRFVGFGGRSIGDAQPKYLNTGQTLVFNKGQILYGLNWSKEDIKAQDQVVIVEGYTDLISLFAVGQRNVVASLGTAFTSAHARLLRRFCSQAVIAFDGDTAGHRAAWRGMEVLHASGLQVRVASLTGGEDPDTFARTQGVEAVRVWLNTARPFREYQIDRIISQHDVETREGKLAASTELVTLLAQLTSAVERDEYIHYAAERLGVREDSLAAEVGRRLGIAGVSRVQNRRNHRRGTKRRRALEQPMEAGEDLREREVLRYLLQEPDLLREVQARGVTAQDFQDPDYRHVFISLSESISDERGTAIASKLLSLPPPGASWEECLESFLAVLKRRRLRKIEEKLSLLENDREGFDVRMELYQLLKEYYGICRDDSY